MSAVSCSTAGRSATEVELLVARIVGVAEVAAYAVPAGVPGCEDELTLAVLPQPGTQFVAEDLVAQADNMLPRFARPGFVRWMRCRRWRRARFSGRCCARTGAR